MSEKKGGGSRFVKKNFYFLKKGTAVPNQVIFNTDLSDSARLLLMGLEALPSDGWDIYQGQLASMLGFGRDKMQRAMGELVEQGYMRRTQTRCEKNQFSHYEYEFYWEPIFKDNPNIQPDEPPKMQKNDELAGNGFSGTGDPVTGSPVTSKTATTGYIGRLDCSNTNTNIIEPPTPSLKIEDENQPLVGGLPKEIKFYQCLQKVDIQDKDKIRLSSQFDEPTVAKAVAHCTKKGFKVQTSLDSSIFYFCKNPDHIVKTKEEIQAEKLKLEDEKRDRMMQRKYLGNEVMKFFWKAAREIGVYIRENQDYMEISNDRIQEKVYYSNDRFAALVAHALQKVGLGIPPMLKGFA